MCYNKDIMGLGLGDKLVVFAVVLSDRCLGTRLSERILTHYDTQVAQLRQQLADIETQRAQLEASREALAISMCAVLLAAFERSPAGGILFEPGAEHEDVLQASINVLVKPGLATIHEHPRPEGQLAYELFPRWAEVGARLARLHEQIKAPDIAAHVRHAMDQVQAIARAPQAEG